jgi:hypothetical protein
MNKKKIRGDLVADDLIRLSNYFQRPNAEKYIKTIGLKRMSDAYSQAVKAPPTPEEELAELV